ncbi:MAG: 8-oxo-dGTP diphosphatase [Candidatus Liptonbacteria bacterium]|nr:8-oxo-dGTP diphosphatase [Candidatus Liptonbacteria bacterium]
MIIAKKVLTLCLIQNGGKVLLGLKKRGFGEGRWNGFGGKVEAGETIEQAAIREISEESGLMAMNLEKFGLMEFEFKGDPVILEVHVFKTDKFKGEPVETEEMRPAWFGLLDIPFEKMWPDDKYWFPLFLDGKKFRAKFFFEGQDKITSYELIETDSL